MPTVFGLLLLIAGILATSYLVRVGFNIFGFAAPSEDPENIRIANISDTSFSVSYETAGEVVGTLSYGKDQTLGKISLDDRDQKSGIPEKYHAHHFTIRNLQPNSTYYFTIISGDSTFMDNNEPFHIVTGKQIAEKPSQQTPIIGKVITEEGTNVTDALLYLNGPGSQTYSSLIEKDGTYIIPINALRSENLAAYVSFPSDAILSLLITGLQKTSTVKLRLDQTNPVPLLTLGNTYDFTLTTEPLTNQPEDVDASESASTPSGSFPSSPATVDRENTPQIISPERGEAFSDQQPSFEGSGLPNEIVEITIESENPIKTSVQTDTKGAWSYRPDTPLAPGEHTITIKTKNSNGLVQTLKRTFIVKAEGSQFVEPSVSPSQATPTPTKSAQAPSPTRSPTPSPTLATTTSPAPTDVPTETPTPTETTTTPAPTLPPTGNSTTIITAIAGTVAVGIGIMLFILTRGSTAL